MIIDGKKIASKINEATKKRVEELKDKNITVCLTVVLVGEDKPSIKFVERKMEKAKQLGIEFKLFTFLKEISEKKLILKIKKIQQEDPHSSIIVQLPLPKQLRTQKILDSIDPKRDADCLTTSNLGKLVTGEEKKVIPPTPAALIHILTSLKVSIAGKRIVVIGKGRLVGLPLGILLLKEEATLTFCDKFTKKISEITKNADIVISAAGVPKLVKQGMVKRGVIILDAGSAARGGQIKGDVDSEGILEKASFFTPVPGGVGPVTIAKLFENCLKLSVDKEEVDKY